MNKQVLTQRVEKSDGLMASLRRRFVRRHKVVLVIAVLLGLAIYSDTRFQGPLALLAKADRLAILFNWPEATLLYLDAESLFKQSGDSKNALAARLGYIWSNADSGVSGSTRREITAHLLDPVINSME